MANGYITLNGKRYRLTPGSFNQQISLARQSKVSISGKILIQSFAFTDYHWKVEILVAQMSGNVLYGNLNDLKTAYGASTTQYIDVFGQLHEVMPEGDLDLPFKIGLKHDQAPFKVVLNLRKRQ